MTIEWMGRYRGLVAAIVRHSNLTSKTQFLRSDVGSGVMLSAQEWQILEYIIEHRAGAANMISISDSLKIAQSSFSKAVKHLCDEGLVERFQAKNNRKNIILLPTEKADSIYAAHSLNLKEFVFSEFFEALDSMDDECIVQFTDAIETLNEKLDPKLKPVELIKKD